MPILFSRQDDIKKENYKNMHRLQFKNISNKKYKIVLFFNLCITFTFAIHNYLETIYNKCVEKNFYSNACLVKVSSK
jgi:hypothetical protein